MTTTGAWVKLEAELHNVADNFVLTFMIIGDNGDHSISPYVKRLEEVKIISVTDSCTMCSLFVAILWLNLCFHN